MRLLLYAVLVLTVVPIQTTLLNHVNILDVRPDLGLIVVCLVGFFGGELDGLLLGIILGWSQDLLSAGELWVNVVSKGGASWTFAVKSIERRVDPPASWFVPDAPAGTELVSHWNGKQRETVVGGPKALDSAAAILAEQNKVLIASS